MELSPYIKDLQDALATVAAPGGKDVATAAALLTDALEPSARLSLIGAMTDAADEITTNLDDLTVEVRLGGRDVEFVVSEPSHPPEAPGNGHDAGAATFRQDSGRGSAAPRGWRRTRRRRA